MYYLYYIFFSAYWTAFEFGEKEMPEDNAAYLLSFVIFLNFTGVFNIITYLGFKYSNSFIYILFFLFLSYLISYILFQKNKRFSMVKPKFEFLKFSKYRKKRYLTIVCIVVWCIIFNTIGVLI